MIPYLLTSFLLSFIACLVYIFALKKKASALQRKYFIYFSFVICLLSPSILVPHFSAHQNKHIDVTSFVFLKPIDQTTLQHYCDCENPNYTHRISYRADAFYHFLVDHSLYIKVGILLAVIGVAIYSFLQIYFLYNLAIKLPSESTKMNEKTVYLLQADGKYPFAAFYLNKPYIILHSKLLNLEEDSRNAIIAHEFSHIQQRNTWEIILLRFLQCVWLFNPVFYFFRRELHLISECIADEAGAKIMKSKKAYAHLLLGLKTPSRKLGLTQALLQKSLKTRIQHLCYSSRLKIIPLLSTYVFTISLQVLLLIPIFNYSIALAESWVTYEKIYTTYPDKQEVMYCTDCEQVCEP